VVTAEKEEDDDGFPFWIIVAAVGGLVVIAIIVYAIFLCKRRGANKKDKLISPGFEMKNGAQGRRISIGDDLRRSMAAQ